MSSPYRSETKMLTLSLTVHEVQHVRKSLNAYPKADIPPISQ